MLTATDNEIEALSPALAQLSALTELNLRCGISSTPLVPLQSTPRLPPALTELSLRCNR